MGSHLDRFCDWPALARQARYRADTLARMCAVSTRQLSCYFARRFGQPPHAWLNEHRCHQARELLLGGLFVKSVAFELGFRDSAHFCRVFKRRYGLTPAGLHTRAQVKVEMSHFDNRGPV